MPNCFVIAAEVDSVTASLGFYGAVLLIVAGCGVIFIPVIWSWLHRRGRVPQRMARADSVFSACFGIGSLVNGILKLVKWARSDVEDLDGLQHHWIVFLDHDAVGWGVPEMASRQARS